MAGIPDKTIIFRKFDLWWPLLTSIFTWAKKWPKWLRTGSLRAVDRRIARPSSFPSFRVRGGGVILAPPTMAKVAETATRARVKKNCTYASRSFEVTRGHQPSFANNFWSKRDRDVIGVSTFVLARRIEWLQYDPFHHHVTLAWLDLRSNFDLDLWKSFYIWFDAP